MAAPGSAKKPAGLKPAVVGPVLLVLGVIALALSFQVHAVRRLRGLGGGMCIAGVFVTWLAVADRKAR